MNNLAFQIYGSTKSGIFQSTWKTDNIGVYVELAGSATASLNWSGTAFSSGYTHIPGVGNTTPLSTSISAISGRYYQIKYTVTGTAGSVTINYGGTSNIVSTYNSEVTITVLTTSTSSLSILPTFDFNGNVKISLKQYVSSIATQVKLPLIGGNYNFWVDWGDGQYNNVTNANYTTSSLHNYSVAGTYTIRISGDIAGWNFGDTGDKLKILTISSWGKLRLQGYGEYFKGCVNLSLSGLTDVLDLSTTTTLLSLFVNCSNITTIPRINEWDTSKVTSMANVFYGTNFDGDISNWNVSKVVSFYDMFAGASKFNNGGSSGINNWLINTTSSVDMTRMFNGASKFNQPLDLWNVTKVTSMSQMFQYCTIFNQSLNNWERTTIGNTSTLVNVINMSNMFFAATAFNNGSLSGIANQLPWNTSACTNMSLMFQNATAFNSNLGTGTIPWDVSKVTTFANMFQSASNFNNGDDTAPINNWNINTVSDVTMASMFNIASKFNRDISGWNVSKVTNFTAMFRLAIAYNNGDNLNTNPITSIQGLDGWNINTTSSVTMYAMFLYTNVFNRPLASWNMTRVNNTNLMFRDALKFNQPLSNWERAGSTLANITNMSGMFCNAYEFNQSIGNWNVSSVVKFGELGDGGMFSNARAFNNGNDTYPLSNWSINSVNSVTMAYMFSSNTTSIFNRDISTWNMTKVTNTSFMFSGTYAFDQPLDNWERTGSTMGNITTMSSMFQTALAFNQDISSWNVSKVTTFGSMFSSASIFNNGDNLNINPITGRVGIDGWNINTVSNVNMGYMFAGAYKFNREVSSWNVSKVTTFESMFSNATAFNNGGNSDTNTITGLTGINGWNINTTATSVSMNRMFAATRDFNRNINDWNVSKVTDMNEMFNSTKAFNQPINSWNTVSVLGMVGMFELATAFNQPIDNWNMTNVTATRYMFNGATIFNQPLSNWERVGSTLANVTSMNQMFQNAVAFNQPIGNWNVSNVANFINFMVGKTSGNFSSTNLDAIYNGWIVNGVKPNISSPLATNISFGTAKYSQAGKPGRDTLLASPNNWRITDGGNETALALDAGNPLSYPGTGTLWTDLSGNNNNGTLVNGLTFDSGNGGSIVFDGTDDYINCGNSTTLQNQTFTYCLWIFPQIPTGVSTLIGFGALAGGPQFRIESSKKLALLRQNVIPFTVSTGTINYNEWNYVCVSYLNPNASYYINGVNAGTASSSQTFTFSDFWIGNRALTTSPEIYKGKISQVQVYNKVLTPTEILANFNATKGRYGL